MNLSILILTYNEAVNLPGCLASVSFSDDIVLLDSQSEDETAAIARAAGATVLSRPFDNYAAQRNYGLAHAFKHDWVLMLDADERVTPALVAEMATVTAVTPQPVTLYRMRRQDMFMGRWLKRSSGYPTWFGRLFRKGRVRVEREINEEYYTDGDVGMLEEHLLHFPFNKGVEYWFERHNRYSTMEAKRLLVERKEAVPWSGFWSPDPMLRRKAFKQFAYRVPCRPFFTFVYLYLLRLGLLDGRGGLEFSLMRAMYEQMISLKMHEREMARRVDIP